LGLPVTGLMGKLKLPIMVFDGNWVMTSNTNPAGDRDPSPWRHGT
jgi:hypothetical protein